MRLRMFALAIRRIAKPDGRRRGVAGWAIVPYIGPQPASLGPPLTWREHRDRRIVGMQFLRAQHMPAQHIDQRTQQTAAGTDPIGQRTVVQLDAFARIDLALPVQRQVIAELCHQHMRQQARASKAALDRAVWCRRLHDARTANEVFSRIHSPREYEYVGNPGVLLQTADGHDARTLDQVSTGQRAAFALSIFLARNRTAASAPPFLLIDDPIAHIDDLNALSFLDYLRDLAVNSGRQIFFATADTRVASLFSKKFSFMGEAFRTINLVREPQLEAAAPQG